MRRLPASALLLISACVPPAEGPLSRGPDYVVVDPASLPPERAFAAQRPPQQVFLNRAGGRYEAGPDDPDQNRTIVIPEGFRDLPAYQGSDAQWAQILSCVQGLYAPFNIEIADVAPTSGDYIEIALGGQPDSVGADPTSAGIAPIDLTTCRLLPRAVGFVFTAKIGPSRVRAICEATAHEIAHPLSLDHAFLCEDPMSYLFGCGDKSFQDVDAECGEAAARPCSCGRSRQNSVDILADKLGEPPGALPDLRPLELRPPAQAGAGDRIQVTYRRENAGTVDAPAFHDAYRLVRPGETVELRTYRRSPLPAGETRGPYRVTLTLPTTLDSGSWNFEYQVDARAAVEEQDEENNTMSAALEVIQEPAGPVDLEASTLSLDVARVAPGGRVRVTYARANIGGTVSGTFADGYYLSTNSVITTLDRLLSASTRGALLPGRSVGPYVRSLTIPADVEPGTYWLGYYVDHQRAVVESSESNNRRAVAITVE